MKINQVKLILIILIITCSFQVNAQERMIQGVVTTFDSIAITGAEIGIKSTKQIVKTDTLGRFTAKVDSKDKIKVMAKGFIPAHVKLDEKVKIVAVNLKMKAGDKAREYAIGYGYVRDAERLSAVSQMNNKDIDFSQYSSMLDLIRGRLAGVQVNGNGDIIIRGVNSINSSNAALIVVDGVPTDGSVLFSMVPSNVKSINVIKDGSSAIYGSRGANGVVLIETKKGGDN